MVIELGFQIIVGITAVALGAEKLVSGSIDSCETRDYFETIGLHFICNSHRDRTILAIGIGTAAHIADITGKKVSMYRYLVVIYRHYLSQML